MQAVRAHLNRVVLGQGQVVERLLVTLIAGGHALLLGVPGLAKTRLVLAAAGALGLTARRVQGTPDLMPADILGCEVLDEAEGRRSLRFVPGPVFAQCLLMDEINRAPPRTQAALLQAMEEGAVTVGGQDHPLPRPFHVLATQNPLEHAGTYPLPEAQRDRFLMCIPVDYPGPAAEAAMLRAALDGDAPEAGPVAAPGALEEAQDLARRLPVGESVVGGVLALVRGLRPGPEAAGFVQEALAWGPSPRAAKGLLQAVRARAVLDGRATPSVEDVAALAVPVLAHRVGPRPGADPAEVIGAACRAL
ncbi:MAG TPA: AAA family ATPase [Rhodospirillaceae bacterium]|jgi:MoxR-like ATPase|nr:AAA family ATPase [Alphaproteobacteria bacterium]HBH26963.1 AAA family ATPase [Rhodospirillaceae bacterium]